MAEFKFRGESDFQKVKRDYDELTRKVVKLEDANRKLAGASQKASQKSQKNNATERKQLSLKSRLAQRATKDVGGLIGKYTALAGVLGIATAALRSYAAEAKTASEEALKFASGQSALALNLGITDPKKFARVSQEVRAIDQQVQFGDSNILARAYGGTVSATGDKALSKNIVVGLADFFRNNKEGLEVASGAAGDVATLLKGDNRSERSIGLVVSAMNQARLTSMPFFSSFARGTANIAPTVGPQGQSQVVESLALQAALSRGTKDPQGPSIASGSTALAVQLQKLLPEKDVTDVAGDVIRKGSGLNTLAGRIKAVQASKHLQKQFFQGDSSEGVAAATFEKKVGGVIQQLLTDPNSQVAREFEANQRLITPDEKAVAGLRNVVNTSTPELRHARAKAGIKSVRDSLSSDEEKLKFELSQDALSTIQAVRGRGLRGAAGIGDHLGRFFENAETLIGRDVGGADPLDHAMRRAMAVDTRGNAELRENMETIIQVLRDATNANREQLRELAESMKNLSGKSNHRSSASRETSGRRP